MTIPTFVWWLILVAVIATYLIVSWRQHRKAPPRRSWKCPQCGMWQPLDEFDFVLDESRDANRPSWIVCDRCKELTRLIFGDEGPQPEGAELSG